MLDLNSKPASHQSKEFYSDVQAGNGGREKRAARRGRGAMDDRLDETMENKRTYAGAHADKRKGAHARALRIERCETTSFAASPAKATTQNITS